MTDLWIAIYDAESGFTELCNVGYVHAETEDEAKTKAYALFGISHVLKDFWRGRPVRVHRVDPDVASWSYYT